MTVIALSRHGLINLSQVWILLGFERILFSKCCSIISNDGVNNGGLLIRCSQLITKRLFVFILINIHCMRPTHWLETEEFHSSNLNGIILSREKTTILVAWWACRGAIIWTNDVENITRGVPVNLWSLNPSSLLLKHV